MVCAIGHVVGMLSTTIFKSCFRFARVTAVLFNACMLFMKSSYFAAIHKIDSAFAPYDTLRKAESDLKLQETGRSFCDEQANELQKKSGVGSMILLPMDLLTNGKLLI